MSNLLRFPIIVIIMLVAACGSDGSHSGDSSNIGSQNSDRDFNGVTMVSVPAGCFMMGDRHGYVNEKPVHEICFDQPFWIDKYEVTNEQYGSVGCDDYSYQSDQPRNCVTWFQARDYCALRGARLPTEAEWEYAARGPDGLLYPWGNDTELYNAVSINNERSQPAFGNEPATVGSIPSGASWVGALDMSGNLWEWTSSLYEDYPYNAYDGRETDTENRGYRVARGGSFFNGQYELRGANRTGYHSNYIFPEVGFRCVRSYESE